VLLPHLNKKPNDSCFCDPQECPVSETPLKQIFSTEIVEKNRVFP
jgi:hypothetical protein